MLTTGTKKRQAQIREYGTTQHNPSICCRKGCYLEMGVVFMM